jgi:hypothetical protein
VLVLRVVAVLTLLVAVIGFSLFLLTRDRRYLTWMSRVVRLAVVLAAIVMLLYVLERLTLAV